jgi:hypothetical protein
VNLRIYRYKNKRNNYVNYLKLKKKTTSNLMLVDRDVLLTIWNIRSLDRARDMATEDRHTPGTGDGSLLEGHGGSV